MGGTNIKENNLPTSAGQAHLKHCYLCTKLQYHTAKDSVPRTHRSRTVREDKQKSVVYNPYLLKSLHEACFHHGLQHQRIIGKPGHKTCSECLEYILIHSQHLRTHNEETREW